MAVGEDSFKHSLETVDALEPALHEMQVLKQNPVSLLGCIEQRILGRLLLTLTHRDIGELLVADGNFVLGSHSLNLRCGVNSGEQHEEDWNSIVSLSECFEDAEGRLLDVPFTHHFSNV